MSIILMLLESILIPLPHFRCPSLTYCLMSIIVVLVMVGNLYSILKYIIDINSLTFIKFKCVIDTNQGPIR